MTRSLGMECDFDMRYVRSVRRLEMSNQPLVDKIRRLIERNPYTGGFSVDEHGLQEFAAELWEAGYESGFADGDGDSYVETQSVNPYKPYKG